MRLIVDSFGMPAMVPRQLAMLLPPMPVDQRFIDSIANDSKLALEMAVLSFVPIPSNQAKN